MNGDIFIEKKVSRVAMQYCFFMEMNCLQDFVPKYPTTCEVEWVDAEDPLFLLYTSGSTGKPKVMKFRRFSFSCFIFLCFSKINGFQGSSSYNGRIHGLLCNNIQVCF